MVRSLLSPRVSLYEIINDSVFGKDLSLQAEVWPVASRLSEGAGQLRSAKFLFSLIQYRRTLLLRFTANLTCKICPRWTMRRIYFITSWTHAAHIHPYQNFSCWCILCKQHWLDRSFLTKYKLASNSLVHVTSKQPGKPIWNCKIGVELYTTRNYISCQR